MKTDQMLYAVLRAILQVTIAIILIFGFYAAASKFYDYGYRIFTEPAVAIGSGREVKVSISEKMSAWKIGSYFEKEGLVKDGKLFALQYLLSEYREEVHGGDFLLNTNMTAEEMMKAMSEQGASALQTLETLQDEDGEEQEDDD